MRGAFLVRRRDEQQIADALALGREALEQRNADREPALHIEHAATGQEGAVAQLLSGAAAERLGQRLHQRFGVESQRSQRAKGVDLDHVEVPGERDRARAVAAHQRIHAAPRQRIVERVHHAQILRMFGEVRQRFQ